MLVSLATGGGHFGGLSCGAGEVSREGLMRRGFDCGAEDFASFKIGTPPRLQISVPPSLKARAPWCGAEARSFSRGDQAPIGQWVMGRAKPSVQTTPACPTNAVRC